MQYQFKKAELAQISEIWTIMEAAIQRRKEEGSEQWQDGYPNPEVLRNDIEKGQGFVLVAQEQLVGYCALLINDEPQYASIEGRWLSHADFVVFHRVAISPLWLGQGCAKVMLGFIEAFARKNKIYSIKADTNFDNFAMMSLFDKLGYSYCGHVYFRGGQRKAYEKVLQPIIP